MQQIKIDPLHAFLRFIPALLFLLNIYAVGLFTPIIGTSLSAIIGGLNSALIGLAVIKWLKNYDAKLLPWEPRGFKIGAVLSIAVGLLMFVAGIAFAILR